MKIVWVIMHKNMKDHLDRTYIIVWFTGWSEWNFTKCKPVIPWTLYIL